jgi:hypothetical protein
MGLYAEALDPRRQAKIWMSLGQTLAYDPKESFSGFICLPAMRSTIHVNTDIVELVAGGDTLSTALLPIMFACRGQFNCANALPNHAVFET